MVAKKWPAPGNPSIEGKHDMQTTEQIKERGDIEDGGEREREREKEKRRGRRRKRERETTKRAPRLWSRESFLAVESVACFRGKEKNNTVGKIRNAPPHYLICIIIHTAICWPRESNFAEKTDTGVQFRVWCDQRFHDPENRLLLMVLLLVVSLSFWWAVRRFLFRFFFCVYMESLIVKWNVLYKGTWSIVFGIILGRYTAFGMCLVCH